jgi:hypothetical protein
MKLLKFSTQNSELAIRVSDAEAKILRVLVGSANGENYGYEIAKQLEGEVSGAGIYVLLSRMENKGLLVSRAEIVAVGRRQIPRRWYRVASGLTLKGTSRDINGTVKQQSQPLGQNPLPA